MSARPSTPTGGMYTSDNTRYARCRLHFGSPKVSVLAHAGYASFCGLARHDTGRELESICPTGGIAFEGCTGRGYLITSKCGRDNRCPLKSCIRGHWPEGASVQGDFAKAPRNTARAVAASSRMRLQSPVASSSSGGRTWSHPPVHVYPRSNTVVSPRERPPPAQN